MPDYKQDVTQGEVKSIEELGTVEGFYYGTRPATVKGRDTEIIMLAPYHTNAQACNLISFWSSTLMKQSFSMVRPGTACKVTFVEKVPTEKGELIKVQVGSDPSTQVNATLYPDLAWGVKPDSE